MSTLSTAPHALRPDRAGFSAIELLVVITIIAVLAGIVAPSIGTIQARMDTASARDSFVLYATRARMLAIDRGTLATLVIDPGNDRVSIELGATVVDAIDFYAQQGVDVTTGSGGRIVVCYSSRGIATPSCNSGLDDDVEVTFTRGAESASVTVRPLGQVRR